MIFPKSEILPEQIDIPGYGGRYYVRRDGTVWRRYKTKDTKLAGHRKGRSREIKLIHPKTGLKVASMSTIMRVTYFRNLPEDYCLRHVNGLENDWSYDNLQPVTRSELGKMTYRSHRSKSVLKLDPETGEVVEIYSSAREAGRRNFCSYQTILDACNQVNKKRKGKAPDGYLYRWD